MQFYETLNMLMHTVFFLKFELSIEINHQNKTAQF